MWVPPLSARGYLGVPPPQARIKFNGTDLVIGDYDDETSVSASVHTRGEGVCEEDTGGGACAARVSVPEIDEIPRC